MDWVNAVCYMIVIDIWFCVAGCGVVLMYGLIDLINKVVRAWKKTF